MFKFFSFIILLCFARSSIVQSFPYTNSFTTHSPTLIRFKAEVTADALVPHEEIKASKSGSAEAKKSLIERVATAQNIGRMARSQWMKAPEHSMGQRLDQASLPLVMQAKVPPLANWLHFIKLKTADSYIL